MFNLGEDSSNLLKGYTPRSILELSVLSRKLGNYGIASGLIYACALKTLQKFISDNSLNITLHSEDSSKIAYTISRDIGTLFSTFHSCQHGHFSDMCHANKLKNAAKLAHDFIEKMEYYVLSDQKREELENTISVANQARRDLHLRISAMKEDGRRKRLC